MTRVQQCENIFIKDHVRQMWEIQSLCVETELAPFVLFTFFENTFFAATWGPWGGALRT